MRFFLLSLSLCLSVARAGPLVFDSGAKQVTLLELFTSQGCSSCPPAERWLNDYINRDALWDEVVPLAWHVDYWDDIGWQDPYARPDAGARQSLLAQAGAARTVYTPGFFANGREWRGWTLRLPPRAADRTPGNLHVEVAADRLSARFPAAGQALELHVAWLGSGIETAVLRGENRDRRLAQEFVVLAHNSYPAADGHWDVPLTIVPSATAPRRALAVWVSAAGAPRPLQATGGWFDTPH